MTDTPGSPTKAIDDGVETPQIVWKGRFLHMAVDGVWEYATRPIKRPAVAIVALTHDRRIVVVEQHRPPVGSCVMELPAGLTGDIAGAEQELLIDAAKRELLEETGYSASEWTELGLGYSSPGLTDESAMLFLARGLVRQGAGGGDDHESIVVHEVPWDDVTSWLVERNATADLKLFAGLYLAQQHLALEAAVQRR